MHLPFTSSSLTPEAPPRSLLTRVLRCQSFTPSIIFSTSTSSPSPSRLSLKSLRRFWSITPSNNFTPHKPSPSSPSIAPLIRTGSDSVYSIGPYRPQHAAVDSLRLGYSPFATRPVSHLSPTPSDDINDLENDYGAPRHFAEHDRPATSLALCNNFVSSASTSSSSAIITEATSSYTYTLTSNLTHIPLTDRSSSLAFSLRPSAHPRATTATHRLRKPFGTTLPQLDEHRTPTGFSLARYIRPGDPNRKRAAPSNTIVRRPHSSLGF